jgi:hypothetical protein
MALDLCVVSAHGAGAEGMCNLMRRDDVQIPARQTDG